MRARLRWWCGALMGNRWARKRSGPRRRPANYAGRRFLCRENAKNPQGLSACGFFVYCFAVRILAQRGIQIII